MVTRAVRDWIPVPHVEAPERLSRTMEVLRHSGRLGDLAMLACPEASLSALGLVHPADLIEKIQTACAGGKLVSIGPEARVGPRSWGPALKAAGGSIQAVDSVVSGQVSNAYALVRPPGHHASASTPMGFCVFNNIAIACRHSQQAHGLEKVAIVDWDVHHGNGTQAIFYDDPSVLFISLQQDGLYPLNSGTVAETGAGRGEGYTINVPLPAGSGDRVYQLAFESVVEPAIRRFQPDLILISAGQDASAADPLGRMSVTTEGFRDMAARMRSLAEELCDGRLVAVQEGGYSLDHLPFCTLAIIESMAGLPPAVAGDPMDLDVPADIRRCDEEAVRAVCEMHAARWGL